ncbi:PYM1 protein, partial [Atrichornis clamosus]|nr:PYM1 protein [Atrichornis clamosus]
YENKYVKFFRSKPELPPGLNPDPTPAHPRNSRNSRTEGSEPGLSKAARRNLKRKEKRKQQQQEKERDTDGLSPALEKIALSGGGEGGEEKAANPGKNHGEGGEKGRGRRIKSLRKKLRQVEELRQRLESGGLPQPTREQLEKLGRRKALEEELRGLELDS